VTRGVFRNRKRTAILYIKVTECSVDCVYDQSNHFSFLPPQILQFPNKITVKSRYISLLLWALSISCYHRHRACKEHIGNVQILNSENHHTARNCSVALFVLFSTYVTENTTQIDETRVTRSGQSGYDA